MNKPRIISRIEAISGLHPACPRGFATSLITFPDGSTTVRDLAPQGGAWIGTVSDEIFALEGWQPTHRNASHRDRRSITLDLL